MATHKELIEKIKVIESRLLTLSPIKNKIPQFKINDQLNNGNIKIFVENTLENNPVVFQSFHHTHTHTPYFVLKISGVWETETHYGLTYKFVKTMKRITYSQPPPQPQPIQQLL